MSYSPEISLPQPRQDILKLDNLEKAMVHVQDQLAESYDPRKNFEQQTARNKAIHIALTLMDDSAVTQGILQLLETQCQSQIKVYKKRVNKI